MKQPEYAPLPWWVERDRGAETIIAANGGVMFSDDSHDTIEGVAEYIVHCVNCHADLLEACEALVEALTQAQEAEDGWGRACDKAYFGNKDDLTESSRLGAIVTEKDAALATCKEKARAAIAKARGQA